jgi:hypothetical protein
VVLSAAALVEVAVTGVYICRCEHPKSQHKREQHGCRALDCGCGAFEADLAASAAAQGVQLATGSPVTEPAGLDLADVPFAPASAVPSLGSTSAQLQRAQDEVERLRAERRVALDERDAAVEVLAQVERERDEAREEVRILRDAVPCSWCGGLGVAPAEAFGRDGDGAPMVEEDQPCPEGCELPAWLVVERNEARESEQALSLVRAELESARRELGALREHQEIRARKLRELAADLGEARTDADVARAELAELHGLVEAIPGRTPVEVIRQLLIAGQNDRIELERLRALIARVEQAAGIVQWEDRGVDLADRVQSIREGRTEAIDVLCDIAHQRDVLAQHQRWLCETCGARYGKPYTDHPCGQLTPITVTTTRGAPTT